MNDYKRLTRQAGVFRLLLGGVIARYPLAMMPLSLLLLAYHSEGSFVLGGVTAGSHALASAVIAPLVGRVIDRIGARPVLVGAAIAYPLSMFALVTAFANKSPIPLLVVMAVVAGAFLPMAGPVVRTAWQRLEDGASRQAAYALDAVVVEIVYISGPAVVALLVAVAFPAAAVMAAATAGSVGALVIASSSRVPGKNRQRDAPRVNPLASEDIVFVLVSVFFTLFGIATIEVAIVAFVDGGFIAGLLLAVWAVGSAFGGFWFGIQRSQLRKQTQYRWALLAFALAHIPLTLAAKSTTMFVLLLVAGATIAPIMALQASVVGEVAPVEATTEAHTWITTAGALGMAFGAYAGGTLVENRGVDAAFLAGACGAVVAFLASTVAYRLWTDKGWAEDEGWAKDDF